MEFLHYSFFDNLNIVNREGQPCHFKPNEKWLTTTLISFQHDKLYYITKGKCSITIDGKEYIGTKGSLFYIPAYTVHGYHNYTNELFEQYYIHFDLYPTNTKLFEVFKLPYKIETEDDEAIKKLFSDYVDYSKSENIVDRIEVKSVILKIIAYYIKNSDTDKVSVADKGDMCMNDILRYIDNNLNKNITNKELSSIARMHPNHLIKFFKGRMGITPAKYVMIQKMEHAKMLLDETDLDLSEIMERIGLEYVSHFSKLFKNFYGVSPANYRKLPPLTRPASYSFEETE